MPGVLGVYTGADLKQAGFGNIKPGVNFPNRDGSPMIVPPRPALTCSVTRSTKVGTAMVSP